MSRRRLLGLAATSAAMPLLGPLTCARAHAATRRNLRFRALWHGSAIGEHRVAFGTDGDRLVVDTHVDIAVRILFFNVFRLTHDAQEVWQSGRLVSVASTTDRDGTRLQVSGNAVADGLRIIGENGPFLATANLLTTNALWDSRIVDEQRLIDIQYGGEVGLVAKLLGEEQVATPRGPVRASRYQMITPHYAGSVFYDGDQRWVKALIELKGQTIEYALATCRIPRAWSWSHPVVMACALAALAVTQLGCAQLLGRPDVVIGTARPADIDYPLGGSICRLFNLDTPLHGLRCAEEPSGGSVANIESLRSGQIDIGIVPSDVLADAVAGEGPFAAQGPATDLRVLFAGHADVFTLVAHRASGIRTVADLSGKRIGIGSPGSRQRANMERVIAALGLTRNDFAEVRELSPAEQNRAFCANELDAIVYSVGHPNGLVRDATLTCPGTLVAVSGPGIDRMLAEYQEYERTTIPAGTYPANPADVPTFGVRAVVVTTARVPDAVAYEITRAVFDNFDDFRRLHPAFEALSVERTAHAAGRAPVHAGAARYYREHGWLP